MERKLIITRWKEQVLTSLLENGEIVEFHCSPNETKEQAEFLDTVAKAYGE